MNNFHVANGGASISMPLYAPKGDGRDTYISFNNGGFWKKKNNMDPFESAHYFHSPKYLSKKPSIPAKTVHYSPDGTGRDVFIKFDEGGILANSIVNPSYITTLRCYNKSSYGFRPRIPDFFMESQRAISLKDYIKVNRVVRSQKELLKRLVTLPEHKLPFVKIRGEKRENNLPKIKGN